MRPLLKSEPTTSAISVRGKLCFFGAGELLRSCFKQLEFFFGRPPSVISDNNSCLWDTNINGIPVVRPEYLKSFSDLTVIITIRSYEAVYFQLKLLGISRIYFVDYERAFFRFQRLSRIISQSFEPSVNCDYPGHWCQSYLSGKWGLVTGASRGFGFEVAKALARLGVNLIVHARSNSGLIDIQNFCKAVNVASIPASFDLGDADSVDQFARSIGSKFPHIDFLINNAAISPPSDSVNFPYSSRTLYQDCFKVNFLAPVILSGYVLPRMIERTFGRVVNISSSISNMPHSLHYACSKASLDKYVLDISGTLRQTGVAMVLVDPGWLQTPMTDFKGLHKAETAVNGVLVALLVDLNGCWISSQDYAGMSLASACNKARALFGVPAAQSD
jgi:3-oxoacyl-[acyl-carrier protein] reductase